MIETSNYNSNMLIHANILQTVTKKKQFVKIRKEFDTFTYYEVQNTNQIKHNSSSIQLGVYIGG